jgi:tetratricopeptide (TPR) repeat protein
MKAAHQAAGRYLERLAKENPPSLAGLSPLECLLEARRHYIAAAHYAPARQITARISEAYRAAGFSAEVERLNREILEYEHHPLPIVWIGQSHLDRGDILLAHEWFEHGLAITGSAPTEESAHCWYALGMMALNQGDDSTARRMFNHLVDIYHQMDNLTAEASAWQQLALLDMNAENDDAARQKLERTLSLEQATSNRVNEARTFYELGFLAAKAQQFETGLRLTTLALLILRGIGHPDQQNVEAGVNALLAHLGYSSDQFNALIQQVEADYQQDDGWQIVRSFHEARPDQNDPTANQTDHPVRPQP